MNESRLMIVMDDSAWTLAALHLACAMARRGEATVLLLKMVPVRHPLLLGTEFGLLNFSDDEARILRDAWATAEDYSVSLDVQLFQYVSYWSGIVDAATQFGVTAVIARIPSSPIPYWQAFHHWWLRRQLARQQQLFLALDDLKPTLVWMPSITLQNDMARLLEKNRS
jgi:hypothetical protein